MVPSSDHDPAQGTLHTLVVERHIRVGQKDPQAVEVLPQIRDGFSERALGNRSLLKRPLMNLLHDGTCTC